MPLKIPSTSPHRLTAERVYRAVMKTVKILIERGVLLPPPPAQTTPAQPESAKPSSDEGQRRPTRFTGILDCRPPSKYRAFRVVEGGKPDEKPTATPSGKTE
jgi:hypothetical protein